MKEQVEFEIKNTILFTLAHTKMKYLGINLTKYVPDLYAKTHKTLIKETKELNKWREIPCSWRGKMSVLPNFIYRFNGVPGDEEVGQEKAERLYYQGAQGAFGIITMFTIFILVMFSQVDTYHKYIKFYTLNMHSSLYIKMYE